MKNTLVNDKRGRLSMYTITARMTKGKEVVGYEVEVEDGKKSIWNKSEVLNMARNKAITNARVCRIKGVETLRGKNISLKSLPSITVKNNFNSITSNPVKNKIWYQQAVQQIKDHDAVKISVNMGESHIPTYINGHIEYKTVKPYNITVHDYDATGQYQCDPLLDKFVDKADMIKLLFPLVSTVINIFSTINQKESYKSSGLKTRNPYAIDTTWKLNCENDCTYTLNFARLWSPGYPKRARIILTDRFIETYYWTDEENLKNLNPLKSYIRLPQNNIKYSIDMRIGMHKYCKDNLYSIGIGWYAMVEKQEDGIYYLDNNYMASACSEPGTIVDIIQWLKTNATQLAVDAFYEAEDKILKRNADWWREIVVSELVKYSTIMKDGRNNKKRYIRDYRKMPHDLYPDNPDE